MPVYRSRRHRLAQDQCGDPVFVLVERTVICASKTAASAKKLQRYNPFMEGQASVRGLKSVYAIAAQIKTTMLDAIVPKPGILAKRCNKQARNWIANPTRIEISMASTTITAAATTVSFPFT